MIAVVGEIMMLIGGTLLLVAGIYGGLLGLALSTGNKHEPVIFLLIFAGIGSALIWAAIHFGPISIALVATP